MFQYMWLPKGIKLSRKFPLLSPVPAQASTKEGHRSRTETFGMERTGKAWAGCQPQMPLDKQGSTVLCVLECERCLPGNLKKNDSSPNLCSSPWTEPRWQRLSDLPSSQCTAAPWWTKSRPCSHYS